MENEPSSANGKIGGQRENGGGKGRERTSTTGSVINLGGVVTVDEVVFDCDMKKGREKGGQGRKSRLGQRSEATKGEIRQRTESTTVLRPHDRLERRLEPRVVRGREEAKGSDERRSVEDVGVLVRDAELAELLIVALLHDLVVEPVALEEGTKGQV
jgi:hypothetical protein